MRDDVISVFIGMVECNDDFDMNMFWIIFVPILSTNKTKELTVVLISPHMIYKGGHAPWCRAFVAPTSTMQF